MSKASRCQENTLGWLASPCYGFVFMSFAVYGRNYSNPAGDTSKPETRRVNALGDLSGDMCQAHRALGMWTGLEQPLSSCLPGYLADRFETLRFTRHFVHMGKFGAPSAKPTVLLQQALAL
jgi:hypothetical protein